MICKGMRGCTHRHTRQLSNTKQPCCHPLNNWKWRSKSFFFFYCSTICMFSWRSSDVIQVGMRDSWARSKIYMFKLSVCFGSVVSSGAMWLASRNLMPHGIIPPKGQYTQTYPISYPPPDRKHHTPSFSCYRKNYDLCYEVYLHQKPCSLMW